MYRIKYAILLLNIALIFTTSTKAQVIDSATIKCSYLFTFQPDSLNPNRKGTDLMVLEIGNTSSLFYSQLKKTGDSLLNVDDKNGTYVSKESNTGKYSSNKWSIILAKNYPVGKITYTEQLIQYYKYAEPLTGQQWQITADTLTLYGLKCTKATTEFRGRDYIGWFTNEIAISDGPWKFSGLPGLIVKVGDTKNQFSFEFIGIEILKNKEPMIIPDREGVLHYIQTTRKELWQLKKENQEDPIQFAENNSGFSFKMITPITPEERKARRQPYNPLELN